jgi:hypothetical protein
MAPVYTELTAAITELRDGPGAGPVAGPAVRRAAGI